MSDTKPSSVRVRAADHQGVADIKSLVQVLLLGGTRSTLEPSLVRYSLPIDGGTSDVLGNQIASAICEKMKIPAAVQRTQSGDANGSRVETTYDWQSRNINALLQVVTTDNPNKGPAGKSTEVALSMDDRTRQQLAFAFDIATTHDQGRS